MLDKNLTFEGAFLRSIIESPRTYTNLYSFVLYPCLEFLISSNDVVELFMTTSLSPTEISFSLSTTLS